MLQFCGAHGRKVRPIGSINRPDSAVEALVPRDVQIEELAGGFTFTAGPLWRPAGSLWFSDVVGNEVRQWTPDGKLIEILNPGGYSGEGLPAGGFNGPNGMTADKDGAVAELGIDGLGTCRQRLVAYLFGAFPSG